MIPTKQNVDSNLDGFESQNFTIQINDKSFRVLLDGLYTNKEQSIVRELWTNAYDSHIAAGTVERPFDCKLPSTFDPTFTIRDYGTSMVHDDVMHLYSTVFASTKTATNDQVGCLGLGSKSPFAYTDSFSVTAYDGDTKRAYLAALNNDGIPTITYLGSEPCNDERGFEVSFAVASSDIERFRKAADNVAIGFDPVPNITGANVTIPEPMFVGDNLRIYRRKQSWDYSGTPGITDNMIKMGPVAYPLPAELAQSVDKTLVSGVRIMLDVPVGSVDFTANREALQLTPQTRQYLSSLVDENMNMLKATAYEDINNPCNTYLEACKTYDFWNQFIHGLSSFRFENNALAPLVSGNVEFNSHLARYLVVKHWTGRTVERTVFSSGRTFSIHVNNIPNVTFVINRDPKMARRMLRFKAFSDGNSNVYWLDHPTKDQIMRLMRCFGLKREQFILIENLPDVEVERSSGGGSSASADATTLRGAYRLTKQGYINQVHSINHEIIVDNNYYWIRLETTKPNDDFRLPMCNLVADMSDRSYRRDPIIALAKFLEIDLDEHPILLLGKQARKKLDVTEDRMLDKVMNDLIVANLPQYLKMAQAENGLSPINNRVLEILNMDKPVNLPLSIDRKLIDTYGEDEFRKVHPFKSKYPLLFATRYSNGNEDIDDAVITEYVEFINNK